MFSLDKYLLRREGRRMTCEIMPHAIFAKITLCTLLLNILKP